MVLFTEVAAGWCLGWVENHSIHRQGATWVNKTIYCKYRQVLLMMDGNIARNM